MYNAKLLNSVLLIALLLLALASIVTPTHSWIYQDGSPDDGEFEEFGPRADRLLIKMLWNENLELQYLEDGEIDTTDVPLTEAYYDIFTNPPLNNTINVVGHGTELSFYMLDLNNDNTTSSPVYPNPMSVLGFRQAIAYVLDREPWLPGESPLVPIWVPMSPAMGKYYLNISDPYPTNGTIAKMLLEQNGFPVNPETGYRFWDRNSNGIEEPDERLELKFVVRSDQPYVRVWGEYSSFVLDSIQIRNLLIFLGHEHQLNVYMEVMMLRNFHLYTGTYSIVEPDPTYLRHCFHSSTFPSLNYNGINDTEYDYWAKKILNATTQEEVVNASHNAQQVFVNKCLSIPLWAYSGPKAMYRRYTGGTAGNPAIPDDGENIYRNITWRGTVNIARHGFDNSFTFLNMHPANYAYGHNENMTIRHGYPQVGIISLNPIYVFWPKNWPILNLIYDRLVRRDPYTAEWIPWMAKNFTVGTYIHPTHGNCTKIRFTLRTDVTWSDGTPLTTADLHFTFVGLRRLLAAHDLPPPSWIGNVEHILDFKIPDAYNFEILFDIRGYLALSWISGTPILPKHVWKPIVTNGEPWSRLPDPNVIGSGPWRLQEYFSATYNVPGKCLFVANKPNSVVQTNFPGSIPINSTHGYFRLYPIYVDMHFEPPFEYSHKIPLDLASVGLKVALKNMIRESMCFGNVTAVNRSDPISSEWRELWPSSSWPYFLTNWIDDGDGMLDPADTIGVVWDNTTVLEWYYVERLQFCAPPDPFIIMLLRPVAVVNERLYLDDQLIMSLLKIHIKPCIPFEDQMVYEPVAGKHAFRAAIYIEEPHWDSWKLRRWINYTFTFWVTIQEDFAGSTLYDDIGLPDYPYKVQLPTPDFKVDMRDIALVARAFGTYPGHERWSPFADINGDYKIEMRDVASVARKFGWIA